MIAWPFRMMTFVAMLAGPVAAEARDGGGQATLRRCGTGTCVLIAGWRADPAAGVSVAGHAVSPRGGRVFSVAVPIADVRDWSVPFARTIILRVDDAAGASERSVRLPIGLLGATTELASLEVSAR